MKLSKLFLAASLLISSSQTFAANEAVSWFGNSTNLCSREYQKLISEYVTVSAELRKLKTEGGDSERIALLEMALEITAGGLDIEEYGMTVVAVTDRDPKGSFNIPTVVIDGQPHALANVIPRDGSHQVQITFAQ